MENNILKITAKKQWSSLDGFIVMLILMIAGNIYILNTYVVNITVPVFLFVFLFNLIWLGLWVFPALIFHIQYYNKNKDEEYEFLSDRIICRKDNTEAVYLKSDIEEITLYGSPNYLAGGWFYVTAFESYNYARIDMKNGESIYLTSLLYPKGIEDVIKTYFAGIPYLRKKKLFCYIRSRESEEDTDRETSGDYYGLFKEDKKK